MSRADGVFVALCVVVGTVGGVALVSAAYWVPVVLGAFASAMRGLLWCVVVIAEALR
jgi:hypothetical protein